MYEVSKGVRSTRNEDGGLVLDIDQGKVFGLNGIAALIFERLRSGQTRSQIIAEISRDFGTPAETVQADLIQFLESLQRQGLIRGLAEKLL